MTNSRRNFLKALSAMAAGVMINPAFGFGIGNRKLKVALIGVGIRGTSFWGKSLVEKYPGLLEFVGLCDNNKGRLGYALEYMNINCPTYDDLEKMIKESKPDLLIVATTDSTHHEFIVKGLEMGCDVLSEKPLTIDEDKCQQIVDAENKSDRKLIVGFNYRWSPYNTKIKELIEQGTIGKVTSVDFHWYLNTYHGASYFRRWHGLKDKGGTLWVHKATHHFDLLNWWLDSDPEQVFAYGDLEYYGANNAFEGDKCRGCKHQSKCDFYWDITESEHMMKLYVENEKYDGYIRDNCLWRDKIDIYDKMSAQIKYKGNTIVNYSLTTYSPFEGWRIAFNGTKGRIEAWLDIPYQQEMKMSQEELHKAEMAQEEEEISFEPLITHKLWEDFETVQVGMERSGHGGGDKRLHDQVFRHPEKEDSFKRAAGLRDGAMSVLIGIAARKSIETGDPINIQDLTSIELAEKGRGSN